MELPFNLVDTALSSTHIDAIDALRAFFLLASCTVCTDMLPSQIRGGRRCKVTLHQLNPEYPN
jgi:hypothetical protein